MTGADTDRGPLDGVRVLDLSSALGAYCTRLLADLGAEVVKVEPPSGDPMRRRPPLRDGITGPEASLVFASYHANKRGITLHTGRSEAMDLLAELGRTADVVVLAPSRRAPLTGFDADSGLPRWARGDAVVCVITPFGLTGPWRDFRATPLISFALGGGMHRVGTVEGPPVAVPGQAQWDEAGIHGALAVLAALEARPRHGGQVIDLSVHEVAAGKDFLVERYDVEAMFGWGRAAGVGFPPTGTWQCLDGPFEVASHQLHHWDAFLTMLDHPEELSEPSLADPLVRRDLFDGLITIIERLMATRSREELFEKGQRAGLPCCPRYTPAEFLHDAQPRARGLFVTTAKEGLGTVTLPWGFMKSTPGMLTLRRPAPGLGEHNTDVFVRELGHGAGELRSWESQGLV
ncbi:MAG TPA: CoA transferase [Acidimicrobiales bacterium]|nr:CoA transferase [Acidimicrobiales bacterium]